MIWRIALNVIIIEQTRARSYETHISMPCILFIFSLHLKKKIFLYVALRHRDDIICLAAVVVEVRATIRNECAVRLSVDFDNYGNLFIMMEAFIIL